MQGLFDKRCINRVYVAQKSFQELSKNKWSRYSFVLRTRARLQSLAKVRVPWPASKPEKIRTGNDRVVQTEGPAKPVSTGSQDELLLYGDGLPERSSRAEPDEVDSV